MLLITRPDRNDSNESVDNRPGNQIAIKFKRLKPHIFRLSVRLHANLRQIAQLKSFA